MSIETLFPAGALHYLIGGLWIGTGVAAPFVLNGRLGGIGSGLRSGLAFAVGLIAGALAWYWLAVPKNSIATGMPWWQLLAGGVLAGFGARLSDGVRVLLSPWRHSAAAIVIFAVAAIAVANLTWWLWGR